MQLDPNIELVKPGCPVCLSLVDHGEEVWQTIVARTDTALQRTSILVIQDLKDLGLSPRQIGKHLRWQDGTDVNPEAAVYCYFRNSHKATSFLMAFILGFAIRDCWELVEGLGIRVAEGN